MDAALAAGNIIQAVYGTVLLICEYEAYRKFKLVVWKRGWLLIMSGTFFIILFSALGMFFAEDFIFKFLETTLTYGLISIGSLNLASNAEKMWGAKQQ